MRTSGVGLQPALTRHPRAPVKAVQPGQAVIAGIGNIHAGDSLDRARIHPSRTAGGISRPEVAACTPRAAPSSARQPTAAAPASPATSTKPGARAGYLGHAHVFRRQGLPCRACITPIIRTAGRGPRDELCPHCQQH
ncbi:MAG: hypothetical protein ACRDPD_04300 [Streptosporangiaceae bacterium]